MPPRLYPAAVATAGLWLIALLFPSTIRAAVPEPSRSGCGFEYPSGLCQDPLTIHVTLRDAFDTPVDSCDVTVTFALNSGELEPGQQTMATGTSDTNGLAAITFPDGIAGSGTFHWEVWAGCFGGVPLCSSPVTAFECSAVVSWPNSFVEMPSPPPACGEPFAILVTLRSQFDQPLPGESVSATIVPVLGNLDLDQVASVVDTTDSTGSASLSFPDGIDGQGLLYQLNAFYHAEPGSSLTIGTVVGSADCVEAVGSAASPLAAVEAYQFDFFGNTRPLVLDTEWGDFVTVVEPGPEDMQYWNLFVRDVTGTFWGWAVKNDLLPAPNELLEPVFVHTAIDLGLTGITRGVPADSIDYAVYLTDSPLANIGIGPTSWTRAAVLDSRFDAEGAANSPEDGDNACVICDITPPAADTTSYFQVPKNFKAKLRDPLPVHVDEDSMECGPGSIARSLLWMKDNVAGFSIPGPQANADSLKARLRAALGPLYDPANGGTKNAKALVEAKLKVSHDLGLDLYNKFQVRYSSPSDTFSIERNETVVIRDADGEIVDAAENLSQDKRFSSTGSSPVWEFIKNEIDDKEDVEILVRPKASSNKRRVGHYMTVVGYGHNTHATKKLIWTQDDKIQQQDTSDPDAQRRVRRFEYKNPSGSSGKATIKGFPGDGDQAEVDFVFSESPKRKPSLVPDGTRLKVVWEGDTTQTNRLGTERVPPGKTLRVRLGLGSKGKDKNAPDPQYKEFFYKNESDSVQYITPVGPTNQHKAVISEVICEGDDGQRALTLQTSSLSVAAIGPDSAMVGVDFLEWGGLADSTWRIPRLAPAAEDSTRKIWAAVDLALYVPNNPLGFAGGAWTEGQTLGDLGIAIVGGQVPGVEGIWWSTTPFTFDSLSTTGYVPLGGPGAYLESAVWEAANGAIGIAARYENSGVDQSGIGVDPAVVGFGIRRTIPNPFDRSTAVQFSLDREEPVTVRVHGVDGRLVRTLTRGRRGPGIHQISWDGRDDRGDRVAPGVYFVRLTAGERSDSRKVTRIR